MVFEDDFKRATLGDGWKVLGGNWNTRNQIARMGFPLELDNEPKKRIVPGNVHHIAVENDAGKLRMFVDKKSVLVTEDKSPSWVADMTGWDSISVLWLKCGT